MGNPRLIILSEQLRGQTFELTGDYYGIGRSDDMQICIVDPTVSGKHSELQRNEDGSYTAVDENFSTNGTRINGVLMTRQKLVNSDILQVGGIECMYDCDSNTPSSISTTKTEIKIDAQAVKPNTKTNLAPEKLQSNKDNPTVKLAFKIAIGVLIVIVLLLIGILFIKLTAEKPANTGALEPSLELSHKALKA